MAKYTGCILTRQFMAVTFLSIDVIFVSHSVPGSNVLAAFFFFFFFEKSEFGREMLTENILLLVNAKSPGVPVCQVLMRVGDNLAGVRYMFFPKYTLGIGSAC